MNGHPTDQAHDHDQGGHEGHEGHVGHEGHRSHGWMMIACCIPMLAIAGILVATGVLSAGFLLVALGCTAMMALMMRGMGHGSGSDG